MQLQWGFVKLLIKESYIATSKSMTLSGKMTFMAPENITLFRYCLVTAKYILSEAEMAQWKAETTHPFFDRCYGKVKCYFFVFWNKSTQFKALRLGKRKAEVIGLWKKHTLKADCLRDIYI